LNAENGPMIKIVMSVLHNVFGIFSGFTQPRLLTVRNYADTVDIEQLIMNTAQKDKISRVTVDGRTIVDMNKLVRDPKVRQTLDRISEHASSSRKIRILRRASVGAGASS
jgi:hypothetical protein